MVLRSTEICRAAFGNGIDMLIPETFQSVCWTQTRTGRTSETNMKNTNMIKKVRIFDNTRVILSPYDRILRLRKVPTFVPLCYRANFALRVKPSELGMGAGGRRLRRAELGEHSRLATLWGPIAGEIRVIAHQEGLGVPSSLR